MCDQHGFPNQALFFLWLSGHWAGRAHSDSLFPASCNQHAFPNKTLFIPWPSGQVEVTSDSLFPASCDQHAFPNQTLCIQWLGGQVELALTSDSLFPAAYDQNAFPNHANIVYLVTEWAGVAHSDSLFPAFMPFQTKRFLSTGWAADNFHVNPFFLHYVTSIWSYKPNIFFLKVWRGDKDHIHSPFS